MHKEQTMNANELADINEWSCCAHSKEVSAMLRQQQAEIEALKKQVIGDEYVFVCKRCGDELGIKFEEKEETTESVMSEHCTCYKLGYSPLNDYALVKQK
jgi:hypothetical protein